MSKEISLIFQDLLERLEERGVSLTEDILDEIKESLKISFQKGMEYVLFDDSLLNIPDLLDDSPLDNDDLFDDIDFSGFNPEE